MPYIKQTARIRLNKSKHVELAKPFDAGELNYLMFKLGLQYRTDPEKVVTPLSSLFRNYTITHGTSYQTYNDIMGAVLGCSLELDRRLGDVPEKEPLLEAYMYALEDFYRNIIQGYEDQKIRENGDVLDDQDEIH